MHLTSQGTCKCGLRCPFRFDEQFNFDPTVLGLPDNSDCITDNQLLCEIGHRFQSETTIKVKPKHHSKSLSKLRLPKTSPSTTKRVVLPTSVKKREGVKRLQVQRPTESAKVSDEKEISISYVANSAGVSQGLEATGKDGNKAGSLASEKRKTTLAALLKTPSDLSWLTELGALKLAELQQQQEEATCLSPTMRQNLELQQQEEATRLSPTMRQDLELQQQEEATRLSPTMRQDLELQQQEEATRLSPAMRQDLELQQQEEATLPSPMTKQGSLRSSAKSNETSAIQTSSPIVAVQLQEKQTLSNEGKEKPISVAAPLQGKLGSEELKVSIQLGRTPSTSVSDEVAASSVEEAVDTLLVSIPRGEGVSDSMQQQGEEDDDSRMEASQTATSHSGIASVRVESSPSDLTEMRSCEVMLSGSEPTVSQGSERVGSPETDIRSQGCVSDCGKIQPCLDDGGTESGEFSSLAVSWLGEGSKRREDSPSQATGVGGISTADGVKDPVGECMNLEHGGTGTMEDGGGLCVSTGEGKHVDSPFEAEEELRVEASKDEMSTMLHSPTELHAPVANTAPESINFNGDLQQENANEDAVQSDNNLQNLYPLTPNLVGGERNQRAFSPSHSLCHSSSPPVPLVSTKYSGGWSLRSYYGGKEPKAPSLVAPQVNGTCPVGDQLGTLTVSSPCVQEPWNELLEEVMLVPMPETPSSVLQSDVHNSTSSQPWVDNITSSSVTTLGASQLPTTPAVPVNGVDLILDALPAPFTGVSTSTSIAQHSSPVDTNGKPLAPDPLPISTNGTSVTRDPSPLPDGDTTVAPVPSPISAGSPPVTLDPLPIPGTPVAPDPSPNPDGSAPVTPDPSPIPDGSTAVAPDPSPIPDGDTPVTPDPSPNPDGSAPVTPDPSPNPDGSAPVTPDPPPNPDGSAPVTPDPSPIPDGDTPVTPDPSPIPAGDTPVAPDPSPIPAGDTPVAPADRIPCSQEVQDAGVSSESSAAASSNYSSPLKMPFCAATFSPKRSPSKDIAMRDFHIPIKPLREFSIRKRRSSEMSETEDQPWDLRVEKFSPKRRRFSAEDNGKVVSGDAEGSRGYSNVEIAMEVESKMATGEIVNSKQGSPEEQLSKESAKLVAVLPMDLNIVDLVSMFQDSGPDSEPGTGTSNQVLPDHGIGNLAAQIVDAAGTQGYIEGASSILVLSHQSPELEAILQAAVAPRVEPSNLLQANLSTETDNGTASNNPALESKNQSELDKSQLSFDPNSPTCRLKDSVSQDREPETISEEQPVTDLSVSADAVDVTVKDAVEENMCHPSKSHGHHDDTRGEESVIVRPGGECLDSSQQGMCSNKDDVHSQCSQTQEQQPLHSLPPLHVQSVEEGSELVSQSAVPPTSSDDASPPKTNTCVQPPTTADRNLESILESGANSVDCHKAQNSEAREKRDALVEEKSVTDGEGVERDLTCLEMLASSSTSSLADYESVSQTGSQTTVFQPAADEEVRDSEQDGADSAKSDTELVADVLLQLSGQYMSGSVKMGSRRDLEGVSSVAKVETLAQAGASEDLKEPSRSANEEEKEVEMSVEQSREESVDDGSSAHLEDRRLQSGDTAEVATNGSTRNKERESLKCEEPMELEDSKGATSEGGGAQLKENELEVKNENTSRISKRVTRRWKSFSPELQQQKSSSPENVEEDGKWVEKSSSESPPSERSSRRTLTSFTSSDQDTDTLRSSSGSTFSLASSSDTLGHSVSSSPTTSTSIPSSTPTKCPPISKGKHKPSPVTTPHPKKLIVSVPLSKVSIIHYTVLECYPTPVFGVGDIVWAKASMLPGKVYTATLCITLLSIPTLSQSIDESVGGL